MSGLQQIVTMVRYLGLRAFRQKANALLALCILVCSGVAATLGFFANNVQIALDADISKYLGAPLVLRSDLSIPIDQYEVLKLPGLSKPVRTSSFTTGAITEDAYQSVSLKGVSQGYPLQGNLLVRMAGEEEAVTAEQLTVGSVWLDQRALSELHANVGDKVQIGRAELLITGVLEHEPDRLTQLQHALPRAMVNLRTLSMTGVALDNSRGEHRVLLSGDSISLQKVEAAMESNFEVMKPGKGRHPFSRLSVRAERMLNVILVLILLMCGGAAASLATHSVQNYAMPATVLRCMGVKRRVVALALCLQLIGLAIVVAVMGCLLAWLVQPFLNQVMEPHMTLPVAPIEGKDLLAPIGIAILTVIAFVVPKLQQLGSISVNSVLRGYVETPKRAYSVPLLAASVVILMLWYSSDNLQLTLMLVGGVIALVFLSITFGWLLSKVSAQCHHLFNGPLKVAVRSIGRSSTRHITTLVCVAITMMAMLMTVTLRGSFLDLLQVQMLETDGNYIFTGLPADQSETFIEVVKGAGASIKNIHPTVAARLVAINDVDIDLALSKESETREETRSRVRLSWASSLPENNRLLEGEWPRTGAGEVSVESEVMTDLGLKIGDVLGFKIGDQTLKATISSRREYKGGGSRMMFWFMFAEDSLSRFEQHRMGGLLIENSQQTVLSQLSKEFSQLRIINLERQLAGIRDIMVVLTRLMNTTLMVLLCGALVVIVATSFVSSAKHNRKSQLLRALGLRRLQCYSMNMVEHFVIGLVACVVGILGVQMIAGALFQNLFAMPYQIDWMRALWLTGVICITFIGIGGLFGFQQLRKPVRLT